MKHVYSPSGSAEAHMLAHLLEQEGIRTDIQGEALLGAVGELPAIGLVKLAVADEDYEKARKLLLAWEKKNPAQKTTTEIPAKEPKLAIIALILVSAGFGWAANNFMAGTNSSEVEIDRNKDGKADNVYHFKTNASYADSVERDRNFDGKFDVYSTFDKQGTPISSKADDNFDGSFETTNTYQNGQIGKSEIDTNGDGKTDVMNLYKYGVLDQCQFFDTTTGKIVRINYYDKELLVSADMDTDRDGKLDMHSTYDQYEQVSTTEKK